MLTSPLGFLTRLGAAGLWLCASAAPLCAQTIRYVDADAPSGGDGATWCTALSSLQVALAASIAGDEIHVAGGVYKPTSGSDRNKSFELLNGVAVIGSFAGCGAPDPDHRDLVTHPSILSGDLAGDDLPGFINDGENSRSVVIAYSGVTRSAVLDGFVIEGGHANGSNPRDRGAGVFMFYFPTDPPNDPPPPPSPTIRNCIIRSNRAVTPLNPNDEAKGGAIYSDSGSPLIENCLIVGNHAEKGGAMFLFGPESTASIDRSTIAFNTADAHQTGGIWNGGAGSAVLNSILWGNSDAGGSDESAQFHGGAGSNSFQYSIVQGWSGAFPGLETGGANPAFVDAAGFDGTFGTADDDFRLGAGSSAINTGDPATSPPPGSIDLANGPRLVSCRIDRGAYESAEEQGFSDFDAGGGVDLHDVSWFQACFGSTSAGTGIEPACVCVFDDDEDGAVGLEDLPAFNAALGGL